jgi:hypothetical protein
VDALIAAKGSGVNANLVALLALGALALVIYAVVFITQKTVSATFARIFGLIVIAVLGVGLGFASISDTARTAGFTLLGTVAGYLAGASTKTAPSGGGGGGAGGAAQHRTIVGGGGEHAEDVAPGAASGVETYL